MQGLMLAPWLLPLKGTALGLINMCWLPGSTECLAPSACTPPVPLPLSVGAAAGCAWCVAICCTLQVYIIHRRDEFRASKVMQQRALAHEKIKVRVCVGCTQGHCNRV